MVQKSGTVADFVSKNTCVKDIIILILTYELIF